MTPGALTEGTVLATGALAASKIRQRVREVLEDKDADYPVPGHPSMRLDENFVDLRRPSRPKALRVSSTSAGQTATPPAASGGVAGETEGPTTEVAPAAATGGVAPSLGTGQGLTPAPSSASLADPAVQSIAPGGPQTGKVIDLDAEGERAALTVVVETGVVAPVAMTATAVATEEGESTPAATTGTAVAEEVGTPTPAAATKEASATETGTSARGAAVEGSAAVEAELPAHESMTGVGTPALVAMTEGAAATGTLALAFATEVVAPTDRSRRVLASAVATVALMGVRAHAPGLSRPLFTLDDAVEWGKWQAQQGELANVRAALSSTLGELDGVVVPGGWALQECSWGKSDFLRLERGLWERFTLDNQWTRELTAQVAAT
ncbi:nucleoporin NSP1-like [Setaria italica]|uniref:nucleoporin NSP1-like n=1 Tax=Setaria italica TaxID=4555 RepID=UPI00035124C8|nr:nucleoporin NSP1-like [Setaria italica]